MTRYRVRSVQNHAARKLRTAIVAHVETRGYHSAMLRASEIETLPTVAWKGQTLKSIRCNGTTGRGPHIVNVPLSLLWSLIDFRAFRCPFHA